MPAWGRIPFLHGACVRIWSLHANGSMAACRFAIGWHGACPVGCTGVTGRVMGTPFAEHTRRKTGTGCVYCRLQNATERLIDTCVFVRALGHRLFASHPPTLILAAASPQCTQPRIQHRRVDALQQRSFSPTRRLDIGPHFNPFDSGGDGRYGCVRNRLSTRRLQAQDRWPVSQPAKGV
jgi:hypothetical protein